MNRCYFGEGAGIAVKKGNARLREVLDYALARVKASGRYEELMLRYFPLPLYEQFAPSPAGAGLRSMSVVYNITGANGTFSSPIVHMMNFTIIREIARLCLGR